MSMTADELNRRLAEALGWQYDAEYGEAYKYSRPEHGMKGDFNPAASADDLRAYVLPEIMRLCGDDGVRKFHEALERRLAFCWQSAADDSPGAAWDALTASPAVLAEAALEALEGKR